MVAAVAPAPSAVTGFYRARLATGNAALLTRVGNLWQAMFDPKDVNGSVSRISGVVSGWVTGAQAGAQAETLAYLRGLYSATTGRPYPSVGPFRPAPGLVGSAADGTTVGRVTGVTPSVYWARKGSGLSDQMAAESALAWLNRLASSEPYRVANETTMWSASNDDRFTGRVIRLTRSNACAFCVQIADRGYLPSHAGFAAHAHCHCTPGPEVQS